MTAQQMHRHAEDAAIARIRRLYRAAFGADCPTSDAAILNEMDNPYRPRAGVGATQAQRDNMLVHHIKRLGA